MRKIRFNVGGDHGQDTPNLVTDNGGQDLALAFESSNRAVVDLPQTHAIDGAATVFYQNRTKSFRVIIPPAGDFELEAGDPLCLPPEYHGDVDKVALHYGPVVPDTIQIVGDHFERHGKRWLVRGTDGFCDLAVLLQQGAGALEPQLQQAQDLGCRVRRVFGCIKNIRAFNPFDDLHAYEQAIPALFDLYAAHGLYGDFDGLVDTGYWGFSLGQCQQLWDVQINSLNGVSNLFNLSLTNEFDHGGNLVGSVNDYRRPPFALCSQGSAVSDAPPPRPGWGIREFHCLKPWPKIFLHEDMLFNREGVDANGARWGDAKPTYLSECARFEEGLPETDERLARTLALESAAFGEGFVFHNEFGKDGRMMGARVARCCQTAMDLLIRIEG